MHKGHRILCVIPARGGSKGLPGKNIRDLAGKPLIAHSIDQAKQSRYIDRVVVSTDSDEIARVARSFGAEVPFLRPAELATDKSSTIDVLLHAMDWMEQKERFAFDILLLLHVTAPLRTVGDIDACVEQLVDMKCDNVFSVTEAHRNPYFNMVERRGNTVRLVKESAVVTRQAASPVFDMNCSIYVWWKDVLRKKKGLFLDRTETYIMPKERSFDIDDIVDFRIVEMLLKESSRELPDRSEAV